MAYPGYRKAMMSKGRAMSASDPDFDRFSDAVSQFVGITGLAPSV
jgi:hypothetical protein